MYFAPWYRRYLPVFYAVIFLITAPLLVLWTAGIRYNFKKQIFERSGAMIVDGIPNGADIKLDGQPTHEVMPHTFASLRPGWHTLEISKPGYSAWKKRLEVQSDYVTFVNHVVLWRVTKPELVLTAPVAQLAVHPSDDSFVMLLDKQNQTNQQIVTWTGGPIDVTRSAILPWSNEHMFKPDLRFGITDDVLIGGLGRVQQTAIYHTGTRRIDRLPDGIYLPTEDGWLGSDGQFMTQYSPRSQRLIRSKLMNEVLWSDGNLKLTEATTSQATRTIAVDGLFKQSHPLPAGNWTMHDRRGKQVRLYDQDEHWLSYDTDRPTTYIFVDGDRLRWHVIDDNQEQALLLHGGEAYLWPAKQNGILIRRQSQPFIQAAWHPSGHAVILADEQNIYGLDLDARDGYVVETLASFDRIYDMTSNTDAIWIAAERSGVRGVWKLALH